MALRLSPLAALCRLVIRRWIDVVRRGRGGQIDSNGTPWTRLPADQLQQQLADEYGVEASVRTVRRALAELATAGALRRERRMAHRWRQDWWYAPTETDEALHQARPATVAARYDATRPPQRPRVADQVLGISSLPTQISKQQPANQQPNSRERKGAPVSQAQTHSSVAGRPERPHGAIQAPPVPAHWPAPAGRQQTLQALQSIRNAVPWLNRARGFRPGIA